MILIGSKATIEYISLNRIIHDWDLIMKSDEFNDFNTKYQKYLIKAVKDKYIYEIPDIGVVEVLNEPGWEPSDYLLLRHPTNQVQTPFGMAHLPSFYDLYDMKRATAEFIKEPKHEFDLNVMKILVEWYNYDDNTEFYQLRRKEIEQRQANSNKVKYDFFHKYHIPEYIVHDYLHEMIADLVDIKLPTYQRITTAETNIAEQLFNNLTHEQKLSLMAEETLVLNLERWYIPQMVENGINYKLVDIFYNNNEGLPTYKILKHCCITGLKGEAEYITKFARENFFEIEKVWQQYKTQIKQKGGFPHSFYDKLFELRDKYKLGEKVGTI